MLMSEISLVFSQSIFTRFDELSKVDYEFIAPISEDTTFDVVYNVDCFKLMFVSHNYFCY